MHPKTDHLWALVLAGGDGTRLQGLTRQLTGVPMPKQYCRIIGERSLLEATLDRIRPIVAPDRTCAVIHRSHRQWADAQLATLLPENVLVQPKNLDTGPGIVLSLLEIHRRDAEAVVAIFPSDHDIRGEGAFRRHVTHMVQLAERHPRRLVLLGVHPDRAESGYGYIVPGAPLGDVTKCASRVWSFSEKPDAETARDLLRCGGLWNTFVMVGRVGRVIELLDVVRPDDTARLGSGSMPLDTLEPIYEELRAWSFSRDFLQQVPRALLVVRGQHVGWSDWGTPEAIERTLAARGITPPWRTGATGRNASCVPASASNLA